MKICFIVGAFPTMKCGVGDYTYNLVNGLAKDNNEVSVITSEKANNSSDKFKIYNVVKKWDFKDLKIILKHIESIKPDVVHIQYPSDEYGKNIMINLLPYIVKRRFKCRVFATLHEYSIGSKLGKIRNFVNIKLADKTVVVENRYIGDIKNDFKGLVKKTKLTYIPIFSNIPKYDMDELGLENLKDKLTINNCKIISYFGFINRGKGFEDIINVLKKLKEAGENVKLLFVGEFKENDEYHTQLLKSIEDNGLSEQVKITGFVESAQMVANYLRLSDVCMLPFKNGVSERNGSFLAAFKQEISILTTSDDVRETFEGVYYTASGDTDAQYELLRKILNEEGKKIVRLEKNSIENVAKKHLELYKF